MTNHLIIFLSLLGQNPLPPQVTSNESPQGKAAILEGIKAIKGFKIPSGFQVDLFAADPHLANPVAFTIDEKNRFYVVETHRLHQGVLDIRGYMNWLPQDLACTSVSDRLELLKKISGNKLEKYQSESEKIRIIVDDNNDGKADRSWVFADGFNKAQDGLAAGLLVRKNKAWFTCIPNFWLLEDQKHQGISSKKTVLHQGFGVHVAFIGHDLHGVIMGPDGRLYFSIGDRGTQTVSPSPPINLPHTGAVFRCEPDGSNLEVFCTGLRNPQELAFDSLGNLFTVDNNSDGGDQARAVYLVPGGDSGWRFGFQFIEKPNSRGPWNSEGLWKPRFPGQPAYIIPPLVNLASGPSGLAYYPGTGFPTKFQNHFFLCDFRGSPGNSGIWSFSMDPNGAGFKLQNPQHFLWSILATDLEFSNDGSLYVSDWIDGWNKSGKGRIYKVQPLENKSPSPIKGLLEKGFDHLPAKEIITFLTNPDLRVRKEAQFALASKEKESLNILLQVAKGKGELLSRVHALWAIDQIIRKNQSLKLDLDSLLKDTDPEIRAQAAKFFGELKIDSSDKLIPLLKDPQPRVRFFAALALAKHPHQKNAPFLFQCLEANQNQDIYIRHGCVMALAAISGENHLTNLKDFKSPASRLGAVLSLRRKASPELSLFLNDSELEIAEEAARAIYDLKITQAFPALAAMKQENRIFSPNLWRRILAANFRVGDSGAAKNLATFAANRFLPESSRLESLNYLETWGTETGPDPVTGLWNPRVAKPQSDSATALELVLPQILSNGGQIAKKAAISASKLNIRSIIPSLRATLNNPKEVEKTRLDAMKGLIALGDEELNGMLPSLLQDSQGRIKSEAFKLMVKASDNLLWKEWDKIWIGGSTFEKQALIQLLGESKSPLAKEKTTNLLKQWKEGIFPDNLKVELWESANSQKIDWKNQGINEPNPANPDTFSFALGGGDAENGKELFFHKTEMSCLRCHKIQGNGGEVGPELGKIGVNQNRKYLVEALVNPNKQIAKGFDPILLSLSNGKSMTGIIKEESAKEIKLMTHEGKLVTIPKKEIEERVKGQSAMPADLYKQLSPRELRDLVEYLASLK